MNFTFDNTRVPQRVWDAEGDAITQTVNKVREAMGEALLGVVCYPNVGHVSCGTSQVLNGVVYHLARGAPLNTMLPFLGPMYQRVSVFNLGQLGESTKNLSKQWKDIIDPPAARGSGVPDVGINVHSHVDLVENYEGRTKDLGDGWYTSLGAAYPSYAGVYNTATGQHKLVIAGGHEQLHRRLTNDILTRTNCTVEDVADRALGLEAANSLTPLVKGIKEVQGVNHSLMAAKVLRAMNLGNKDLPSEPFKAFNMPISADYACFYNTVREEPFSLGRVYTISQGVADVSVDVVSSAKNKECISLYMFESPAHLQEFSVQASLADKLRFFPITTGCGVTGTRLTDKERSTLALTGVSNVHEAGYLSYRPCDANMRVSLGGLLGQHGWAAVMHQEDLAGVAYGVTSMDPRRHTPADCLKYTEHLKAEDMISMPTRSAPVKLIFNTFPNVREEMMKQGKDIPLAKVLPEDSASPHFTRFPRGALMIAQQIRDSLK